MLVEEVIFALVVHQTVGVIYPIVFRGEMKFGTKSIRENTWGRVRLHGAYLILFI